jgi:hypothetical protein
MQEHNRESNFWLTQRSSLHRGTGDRYYGSKAAEHLAFIDAGDRQAGAIDLACGAGELLSQLAPSMKIVAGLDTSPSMLAEASRRLDGARIRLVNEPAIEHLAHNPYAVWMTTGGLNQYLDPTDQLRLLDLLASMPMTRTYYMFDCVDPIRYRMLPLGIGYLPRADPKPSVMPGLRPALLRARAALQLCFGDSTGLAVPLRRPGMGWGYPPRFWIQEAARRGLTTHVVSSLQYEYRYHVAIGKNHQANE